MAASLHEQGYLGKENAGKADLGPVFSWLVRQTVTFNVYFTQSNNDPRWQQPILPTIIPAAFVSYLMHLSCKHEQVIDSVGSCVISWTSVAGDGLSGDEKSSKAERWTKDEWWVHFSIIITSAVAQVRNIVWCWNTCSDWTHIFHFFHAFIHTHTHTHTHKCVHPHTHTHTESGVACLEYH